MTHLTPPSVKAAPSSFFWAMRLLPQRKRDAMFEVYAFCRDVDDIADGDLPQSTKLDLLCDWRHRIDDILDGTEAIAFADGFSKTVQTYALNRDDLHAVIDGMEMDAGTCVRITDEAELDLYMDRVASAVGRLANKVFGLSGEAADRLAHHLGCALQLTNILRDIAEDADIDRLYIPRTLLDLHGVRAQAPKEVLSDPNLHRVLEGLAERARKHYISADAALAELSPRASRPVRIMRAVYARLLEKLESRGWDKPLLPVKLSKFEKLLIAVRAGWL